MSPVSHARDERSTGRQVVAILCAALLVFGMIQALAAYDAGGAWLLAGVATGA